MRGTFTVLPILAVLVLGLFSMPLNVARVDARGLGSEHFQPGKLASTLYEAVKARLNLRRWLIPIGVVTACYLLMPDIGSGGLLLATATFVPADPRIGVAGIDTRHELFNGPAAGRWAAERQLMEIGMGRQITANALRPVLEIGNEISVRSLAALRKDEWIEFDEAVVSEAQIRLKGIADLMARGLTKPVANGMGKTVLQWEELGDMTEAWMSMDPMVRSENDLPEFALAGLPLPLIHKDWFLNIRHLAASRERGEALDTTTARIAARKVAEKAEFTLFQGATKTFAALPIYGYTNHPDRLQVPMTAPWGTTTGANILIDVQVAIGQLEDRGFFGPYHIYVGAGVSVNLTDDFKAESDITTRERILKLDRIDGISVVDQMPVGEVVVVQMTSDVVRLVEGEPIQTIQWDVNGGMGINFKTFAIWVPNIRSISIGAGLVDNHNSPGRATGIAHIYTGAPAIP